MNPETDRKWIIVRIDGKIASVSTDYRHLSSICSKLAAEPSASYSEISAKTAEFGEVWNLRKSLCWDDLHLFGSPFQVSVWKKLFGLTHEAEARLVSYSGFAESCGNRSGVRAVAHAVGLNPVAVIIPCHLVVPKETIDRITDIREKAQSTIFKGDDLCLASILEDSSIHFGGYALGRGLKRELIRRELLGL